jgi:hypothetical protein
MLKFEKVVKIKLEKVHIQMFKFKKYSKFKEVESKKCNLKKV